VAGGYCGEQVEVSSQKYPRGKLRPDYEGRTEMAIYCESGVVVIRFPRPVAWLGLPPDMARDLAAAVLNRADEAERSAPKRDAPLNG
jgi:hypothetical protein